MSPTAMLLWAVFGVLTDRLWLHRDEVCEWLLGLLDDPEPAPAERAVAAPRSCVRLLRPAGDDEWGGDAA